MGIGSRRVVFLAFNQTDARLIFRREEICIALFTLRLVHIFESPKVLCLLIYGCLYFFELFSFFDGGHELLLLLLFLVEGFIFHGEKGFAVRS